MRISVAFAAGVFVQKSRSLGAGAPPLCHMIVMPKAPAPAGVPDTVTERKRDAGAMDSAWKMAKRELDQFLLDNPETLFPGLQHIKSLKGASLKMSAKRVKGQGILGIPVNDDEPWPVTYHIMKKVPKYWLAHWIAAEIKDSADPSTINLVDDRDPDAIRKLFECATGIALYNSVPKELHNKIIMSRFFSWRHRELGYRLRSIFANHVGHDGAISWDNFPVYTWVVDQADPTLAIAVRHCSGLEVPLWGCVHNAPLLVGDSWGGGSGATHCAHILVVGRVAPVDTQLADRALAPEGGSVGWCRGGVRGLHCETKQSREACLPCPDAGVA